MYTHTILIPGIPLVSLYILDNRVHSEYPLISLHIMSFEYSSYMLAMTTVYPYPLKP